MLVHVVYNERKYSDATFRNAKTLIGASDGDGCDEIRHHGYSFHSFKV